MTEFLVASFFIWVSYKLFKFAFILAKRIIGKIGPFLVASVPGVATYIITQSVFGVGVSEASLSGIFTAAVLGTMMSSVG